MPPGLPPPTLGGSFDFGQAFLQSTIDEELERDGHNLIKEAFNSTNGDFSLRVSDTSKLSDLSFNGNLWSYPKNSLNFSSVNLNEEVCIGKHHFDTIYGPEVRNDDLSIVSSNDLPKKSEYSDLWNSEGSLNNIFSQKINIAFGSSGILRRKSEIHFSNVSKKPYDDNTPKAKGSTWGDFRRDSVFSSSSIHSHKNLTNSSPSASFNQISSCKNSVLFHSSTSKHSIRELSSARRFTVSGNNDFDQIKSSPRFQDENVRFDSSPTFPLISNIKTSKSKTAARRASDFATAATSSSYPVGKKELYNMKTGIEKRTTYMIRYEELIAVIFLTNIHKVC